MKKILYLLLILCNSVTIAQTKPDYQKLSKACELWGLIKYFHPAQPGHKFDSAFSAAVPKMLAASNDQEWNATITEWLSVLNDRHTRVLNTGGEFPDGEFKSEFMKDSVLLVTINGSRFFTDWPALQQFAPGVIEKAKVAKGIILDLRQPAAIVPVFEGYMTLIFDTFGLNQYFGGSYVPQSRSVYHSGFRPERGATSGGYSTNSIVRNYASAGNYTVKNPHVVWIVNEYTELPAIALSQQKAGFGSVLSTIDRIDLLFPLSNTFRFSDDITIKYKIEELTSLSDSGFKADAIYKSTDDVIEKARGLLRNSQKNKQKISSEAPGNQRAEASAFSYPPEKYPSVGYRVLAAAKIYTVIHNFFPYHQFMDKSWSGVLPVSLPEFVNAKDDLEYGYAVAKMYSNIQDSHGFISGNTALDKLYGQAPSPLRVNFTENKIVIYALRNDSICKLKGISAGDIVHKVNGVPVEKLMEPYRQYYSYSTSQAINKTAAQLCIRGVEGTEGVFTIEDGKGKVRDIKLTWTEAHNKTSKVVQKREEILLVNSNIGYADLSRMAADRTDEMFEKFKNTKAIIFDMRGYPKGTAWSIAPRLTDKKNVGLALFRKPEVLAPNVPMGEMLSRKGYTEFVQIVAPSDKWKYNGKIVMLINEDAMSQAEHTGLFFESVTNTTFIGSPTVGANGDVTNFSIPGNIWLSFSGQGVWHTDGRQLQRLGLQPHVPVKPTIKGIQAGKDEVFDKAVAWITANVR